MAMKCPPCYRKHTKLPVAGQFGSQQLACNTWTVHQWTVTKDLPLPDLASAGQLHIDVHAPWTTWVRSLFRALLAPEHMAQVELQRQQGCDEGAALVPVDPMHDVGTT